MLAVRAEHAHRAARSPASRRPSGSSATSARAATGALQPASSVASSARSAVTAARVCSSSSAAEQLDEAVVARPALHRQRALRGGGQHELGSRISVISAARPSRRRPAAARTTASSSPVGDLAQAGVDVAAHRLRTRRPRPSACSWAIRRGAPVPIGRPAGSSASVDAVTR